MVWDGTLELNFLEFLRTEDIHDYDSSERVLYDIHIPGPLLLDMRLHGMMLQRSNLDWTDGWIWMD